MAKHRNLTGRHDTPSNEDSRSSQFNVSKGFRLQWPILVFMRINLWEEFVKVWHLQMAKMSLNYDEKIQNNRLPVGFGFRSRRLFCTYCYVTWVYRFSYMYVKRSLRALRWISIGGGCRAILPHLLLKHIFRCVQAWILIEHVKSGADRNIVWLSYNNIYSHGETSKFDRTPRTRPPMKTLDLRNLTSQRPFRLDWPKYYVDVIKFVGGVSYRVNMSLPVASRWRYYYNWIWSCRSLHIRILIKRVKFGVDRT